MKAHVQSKKQVHMLAEEKKAKTQKKSDEGDEVVGFGEHAPSPLDPNAPSWHHFLALRCSLAHLLPCWLVCLRQRASLRAPWHAKCLLRAAASCTWCVRRSGVRL
jgi:hypothetical protein